MVLLHVFGFGFFRGLLFVYVLVVVVFCCLFCVWVFCGVGCLLVVV